MVAGIIQPNYPNESENLMTAKIILNPYADRWTALARRPEAEAALKDAGIDYDLVVSEHPGHGIDLATQAVREGYDPIIAAGGDSTYNEIANGIVRAVANQPSQTVYGILPMGTANDLADNLGIPKDLREAAKIIAKGQTRRLDVCQVNDRCFVNNSGIGLETTVTVIQMGMKRLRGTIRYLVATLIAIKRNPGWMMDIEWDGGEYHGPVKLVSVGNNPRTGGVFYTVPNANPFDGKLSFVYGNVNSRGEILRLLPRLMQSGEKNYTNHPSVHEIHCTWIKIHTEPATPAHTDGEVFDLAIQDLEYRIYPGKIPMLLPINDA
jgi:diacylglycerol kinase (ATP)